MWEHFCTSRCGKKNKILATFAFLKKVWVVLAEQVCMNTHFIDTQIHRKQCAIHACLRNITIICEALIVFLLLLF